MIITLRQNDTLPLVVQLKDRNGVVDLTGAIIEFGMRNKQLGKFVSGVADIVEATAGTIRFNWDATDLDTVGRFDGEFEVTFPSGLIQTFPGDGYLRFKVIEEIA